MEILVSLVSDGPNAWMPNEIEKEPKYDYEEVLRQVDKILHQWDYNIDLEVMFPDFKSTFELLKLNSEPQCHVCQHYALWTLAFATRKMNSKKETNVF